MKRAILIRIGLLLLLSFVLTGAALLYVFRSSAISSAKEEALTIAELVRDTLTSYMIMGVIDKRDEFLSRVREMKGVKEIRVVRGPSVVKQFGYKTEFELPRDELEKKVLEEGRLREFIKESPEEAIYRVVIPYKAEPVKGINCLKCHQAKPGEILGAISLSFDLTAIRSYFLKVFAYMLAIFLIILLLTYLVVSRYLSPISSFLGELVEAMKSAKDGNFSIHIQTDPGYEGSLLKKAFEDTFSMLSTTFKNIEENIRAMIGYGVLKTGNVLSDTAKIVDELLKIYRFKRVIEKDARKVDVYKRLVDILDNYMSLDAFSLYEIDQHKNGIKPIHVKGMDRWCKEVIFENANECRAKRTGMDVDSKDFSCICPNFLDEEACTTGKLNYYCIPVYVGGSVGNVLQLVYESEMEPFIRLVIPYIKGYLNEASPVLEARTYMDILREQSLRDQLTGLYNRRFLEETIDKIAAQIKRRGTTLGILMIDVDYFKQVNDQYGHDVGDLVLKETARVISKSVRESDLVIRYGGEEFMVLLVDVQPGKSEEVAEKIRRAVEEHLIEAFGITLKKTVSIGVSEFPTDSDRIWQCIKFADVALYKAKELGRNRVVRFRPEFWEREEY